MKKLLLILLAVCLVFAGAVWYMSYKGVLPGTDAAEATDDAAATETPAAQTIDYAAIYALHEPDEVVMTADGKDVTWGEYFYMLYSQGQQVSQYMQYMSYYGMSAAWTDDVGDGSGETYAQYVVESAERSVKQLAAIEGFAEENKVELTEQNLADIETQRQEDITASCGEGADEAAFEEYLASIYLTPEGYDWINTTNQLYQQSYIQIYGENGELYSDESAMQYLTDNGYIAANHILISTVDAGTGAALDEAAKAEKKATADKLYAELSAITDKEALLKRFKELKEEYCEDSGKTKYPDGYTFTPGTMATEFETACNALEDYGLSEPVESSYGYHIILRLPLDVDGTIEYSDEGTALTARSKGANSDYGAKLQAYLDTETVKYADGFEKIDLLEYLK